MVADVRQDALEKKPEPEIFVPYWQQPPIANGHGYQNQVHMHVVARVAGDPNATVAAIRKFAAQMDNNQPVYGVRTMSGVLAEATALRRLHTTLMEIFAGFALLLSAIGIYGVISHDVHERTAEIGLRMAVGATAAKIHALFFLQGLKLIFFGALIGLTVGLACGRILRSFLFDISPHDPTTLFAVGGLLLIVSFCAVWLLALRAVRVDPIVALRDE